MPTHYVEDYDGPRNKDAVPATPDTTPATPVEGEVTAKVDKAPAAAPVKKSTTAQTKS